jgi:hypothetical protein
MLGENRDPLHRYRHWVAYLNWIFGSSGGSEAVVALGALVLGSSGGLREQWWLTGAVVALGSSGRFGSIVSKEQWRLIASDNRL